MTDLKKISEAMVTQQNNLYDLVTKKGEHDCHLSGEDGCDCCDGEHETPEQRQERADYKHDEFIDDQINEAQFIQDEKQELTDYRDEEIKSLNNK